jgi:hypothetical protein
MRLVVADNAGGTSVRCPGCNTTFTAAASAPPVRPAATGNPQFQAAPTPAATFGSPGGGGAFVSPAAGHAELPGHSRAIAVMSLLGVMILSELFAVLTNIIGLAYYLSKTPAQVLAETDELVFPTVLSCCSSLFYFSILIGTAVTFCLWLYQAESNLQLLSVSGLHYSPAWAIGWFFIPGANFVLPVMVMQELYKASDPTIPPQKPLEWRNASPNLLIFAWWASLVIGQFGILISIAVSLPGNATSRGQHLGSAFLSIIASVFTIAAAGLILWLVRQIQERQKKKFQAVVGH